MLVYLARPIDQHGSSPDGARNLLRHLVGSVTMEVLTDVLDAVVFQPDGAYAWPRRESQPAVIAGAGVDRINRAAIRECDAVVAVLVSGMPTLGVPSEVEYALNTDVPVVLVCDPVIASTSVQVAAWRGRGLRVVPLAMSESQNALVQQRLEVRAALVAAAMNRNRPKLLVEHGIQGPPPTAQEWQDSMDLQPAVQKLLQEGRERLEKTANLHIDISTPDGLAALRKAARIEGWALGEQMFGPRPEPVARPEVLLVTEAQVPEEYQDLTTDFGLSRAYDDDAGFDLSAIGDYTIEPTGRAMIQAQVRIAPPPDHWALILGRSSTWAKLGLMTIPGVIDTGWRGPLYVQVFNPHGEVAKVRHNQRIGQLILLPTWQGRVERTMQLPEHKRGTNGFGSSGE